MEQNKADSELAQNRVAPVGIKKKSGLTRFLSNLKHTKSTSTAYFFSLATEKENFDQHLKHRLKKSSLI